LRKMSQSPLARSTRRSLPAFAHPPSRLSKSTSTNNFRDSPEPLNDNDTDDSDEDSPPPTGSSSGPIRSAQNTPTGGRYARTTSTQTSTQTTTPRHTPSRTYSTPQHTPKIVYSPYATNSPHAGPSRSASIPFDMAASAKDARRKSIGRKELTPEVGAGSEASPAPPVVKKNGRKGIIRRKPLYKR